MHDSNQFKHGILSYFKSIYMGNLFVKMREKIVGLYKNLILLVLLLIRICWHETPLPMT